MESEEGLKQELEGLQKQLGKKLKFEDAVSSIKFLVQSRYLSSSPPLRRSFYSVVCRVATILKTRYTAPGFWRAGLELFEVAERLTSDVAEKGHLRNCIAQAKEHLDEPENSLPESSSRRGYLFEGHLTVDPEPPLPSWLVLQNLATASRASNESELSGEPLFMNSENFATLLEGLTHDLESIIPEIIDNQSRVPRIPPASKEVVANLPVISVTEEILAKLEGPECAICKEKLVVDDKMQELPCKHMFHPPCLKPWLDEHSSCPICRHELQTDDHAYESWKEREKEAEEERKGAANAVRGGEHLYI